MPSSIINEYYGTMTDLDYFYDEIQDTPQYKQNYVFNQMLLGLLRPMVSLLCICFIWECTPVINAFIISFIQNQSLRSITQFYLDHHDDDLYHHHIKLLEL